MEKPWERCWHDREVVQNKTKQKLTKTNQFKTKTNLISYNSNEASLDQSNPESLLDIYFTGLYNVQPPLLPGLRGFVFHNLLFSSPTKNCVWRGTGHSSILLPTLRVSFPDPFLRLRYKTKEERHKVFTQYRRHLVLRENFHLSVCLIMPET